MVIVAPCSYALAESFASREELTGRPGWADLPAVRDDRAYVLDGRALSRWTPCLAGECQRIATVLHPDLFGGEPQAEPLGDGD